MKKLRQSWIVIDILFLLFFFAVYFSVFGWIHPATLWVDLLFVLVAHAGLLYTVFTLPSSKNGAHLSGVPLLICVAYIVLTTALAVVFTLGGLQSATLTLVTQAVLLLLALTFWIANRSMTQHTLGQEKQQQQEALLGSQIMRAVLELQGQASGDEVKQRCGRLMDAVKAMPKGSSPAVADIEQTIVQALSNANAPMVDEAQKLNQLDLALAQITLRNNMLKAM